MLHLAFTERALLADEMGLGKTIQAIAACALLHRLGKARRVLVVTSASLESEWEEQIEHGKPAGYRHLDVLHARIRPYLLRRRKADVETELPACTDRNHLVPLGPRQRDTYAEHEQRASRLVHTARRRPLTQQEQDRLLRELAMMRMICDTNFILGPEDCSCSKLAKLETILEECRDNPEVKFSSSPNGKRCSCWRARSAKASAPVAPGTPAACRSSVGAGRSTASRPIRPAASF